MYPLHLVATTSYLLIPGSITAASCWQCPTVLAVNLASTLCCCTVQPQPVAQQQRRQGTGGVAAGQPAKKRGSSQHGSSSSSKVCQLLESWLTECACGWTAVNLGGGL